MSHDHTDGGPAFPGEQGHIPEGTWNQTWEPGMTIRQWYKGMAMQGLCANGGVLDRLAAAGQGDYPSNKSQALEAAENGLVTMAARFADAQLAEDAEHAKEKP